MRKFEVKDYKRENTSQETILKDGIKFLILWFNYKDSSYPCFKLYQESTLEKRNEYSEGGNFYYVNPFLSRECCVEYINNYSSVPTNEVVRGNDLVRIKHNRWYARKENEFMRVQYLDDYEDLKVDVCCGINPSCHKNGGNFNNSISGGPFNSIPLGELRATKEVMSVVNWCWGVHGSGGSMGVYYEESVRVWDWV